MRLVDGSHSVPDFWHRHVHKCSYIQFLSSQWYKHKNSRNSTFAIPAIFVAIDFITSTTRFNHFDYTPDFMTSWLLSKKRKVVVAWQQPFSKYLLCVDQIIWNNHHSSTANIVHTLHPQHLIFRFECFRYFFFGKLFYQPRKHCFCLPFNVSRITVQFVAS